MPTTVTAQRSECREIASWVAVALVLGLFLVLGQLFRNVGLVPGHDNFERTDTYEGGNGYVIISEQKQDDFGKQFSQPVTGLIPADDDVRTDANKEENGHLIISEQEHKKPSGKVTTDSGKPFTENLKSHVGGLIPVKIRDAHGCDMFSRGPNFATDLSTPLERNVFLVGSSIERYAMFGWADAAKKRLGGNHSKIWDYSKEVNLQGATVTDAYSTTHIHFFHCRAETATKIWRARDLVNLHLGPGPGPNATSLEKRNWLQFQPLLRAIRYRLGEQAVAMVDQIWFDITEWTVARLYAHDQASWKAIPDPTEFSKLPAGIAYIEGLNQYLDFLNRTFINARLGWRYRYNHGGRFYSNRRMEAINKVAALAVEPRYPTLRVFHAYGHKVKHRDAIPALKAGNDHTHPSPRASAVDGLEILGDFIDFQTFTPSNRPPAMSSRPFDQIMQRYTISECTSRLGQLIGGEDVRYKLGDERESKFKIQQLGFVCDADRIFSPCSIYSISDTDSLSFEIGIGTVIPGCNMHVWARNTQAIRFYNDGPYPFTYHAGDLYISDSRSWLHDNIQNENNKLGLLKLDDLAKKNNDIRIDLLAAPSRILDSFIDITTEGGKVTRPELLKRVQALCVVFSTPERMHKYLQVLTNKEPFKIVYARSSDDQKTMSVSLQRQSPEC